MRTSRLQMALVGLALSGLVGGCSRVDAAGAFPALGSNTAPGPSSVEASPLTADTSGTSPSATPTSVAPTPVPAPAAPAAIAPPSVYRGSGNLDLAITKPAGATAVIATITGNADRHNF